MGDSGSIIRKEEGSEAYRAGAYQNPTLALATVTDMQAFGFRDNGRAKGIPWVPLQIAVG